MFTRFTPEEATQVEDVTPHAFTFLLYDAHVISAPDYTGLCEALIDGYADIEESDLEGYDPHLAARVDALNDIATVAQANILAADDSIIDRVSEEALTALMAPKGGDVLEFHSWPYPDVPLLLMATDYMPYNSMVPAPEGDGIIWLNPHDERRFVASLARLGFGELFISEAMLEEEQAAAALDNV